ncbi:hypothetical protein HHI36_006460 [Cryptolaemus montrouzieri]|uniref:Uncharacterized protein n=1 Tax=Cryptolaemus montrouzieri TaxID=559131 RepID=A0ABD2NX93_9CUCU
MEPLKVSLIVSLSISLVFSLLQTLSFFVLSFWSSLVLAMILSTTFYTLAFYGTLTESYVALYMFIGLRVTVWILETIFVFTIGIPSNLDVEKNVLNNHELMQFQINIPHEIGTWMMRDHKIYSVFDALQDIAISPWRDFPRENETFNTYDDSAVHTFHSFPVQFQKVRECQSTILAWFTILANLSNLISVVLAVIYACHLHTKNVPNGSENHNKDNEAM